MEKFIVIYMAGGYDGDDNYCFGNTDIVAVKDTYGDAELIARQEVNNIAESFANVDPEEFSEEEYTEMVNEAKAHLDIEETFDNDGHFVEATITHNDDMFPHLGMVKIIKIMI